MQKETLTNIGLAIGSVFAFALIIEFGLRITGLQTVAPNPPEIYRQSENPDISYELIPDLKNEKAYRARVSTNSLGFRSAERDDRPLVAVLGDSITFGYGVNDDETLSAHLESLIPDHQFFNAAVPGYQLGQQTAAYKEKVDSLNPGNVIVVFYWNDLDGHLPGILAEDGTLRPHGWEPSDTKCSPITDGILGLLPGKCWLDTNSAFYKALKKLVNLRQSKSMQHKQQGLAQGGEANDIPHEKLAAYERDLRELARVLPASRTFVIWPDNYLHPESKPELIAIARRNGFTVVDLYEIFGNTPKTLSWDTVHPHPDTLLESADFVSRFLDI